MNKAGVDIEFNDGILNTIDENGSSEFEKFLFEELAGGIDIELDYINSLDSELQLAEFNRRHLIKRLSELSEIATGNQEFLDIKKIQEIVKDIADSILEIEDFDYFPVSTFDEIYNKLHKLSNNLQVLGHFDTNEFLRDYFIKKSILCNRCENLSRAFL